MDFTVYVLHCWAMLNVCMLSSRDSSTRCALKCAVRLLRRRLTSVFGPRPPPCSTETFFLHHCKFHFPFRQDRIFLRNFLFCAPVSHARDSRDVFLTRRPRGRLFMVPTGGFQSTQLGPALHSLY